MSAFLKKTYKLIYGIINRIKSDFFIPNRISDYEKTIKKAIDNGYDVLSLSEFFYAVKNNETENRKILLIRQDIDSDPKYSLKWLEVNKKYGIKTSFYFRLCTLNYPVMKKVHEMKSDCGYHYEELATFAKRKKITDNQKIREFFPEIRAEFIENFKEIEEKCGFKITSIASHGDFANRVLQIPNKAFINDEVMVVCNLDFEAYQPEITSNYSINIIDGGYPNMYRGPISVSDAIEKNYPVIHMLIHPKHWRSSWYWNIYENSKRVIEGLKYR